MLLVDIEYNQEDQLLMSSLYYLCSSRRVTVQVYVTQVDAPSEVQIHSRMHVVLFNDYCMWLGGTRGRTSQG
jgi:hypothetical protein